MVITHIESNIDLPDEVNQCSIHGGLGLGLVRMPQKATYKTRYIIITIALAALADSAEPKSL